MVASSTALVEIPQASDEDIRELVIEELNRITAHALFKDTTRMKRFLKYVVNESLEGRDDRLKGYSIGLEVFDRPEDFDPQADTIVRVQAGQLRRRLDLYYADDGMNNPVRILVPKGRYAPVFEMRRNIIEAEKKPVARVAKIEHQNRPGIAVLTFQDLSGGNGEDYFAEGLTAELINALVQFRYLRIVARNASVFSPDDSTDLGSLGQDLNVQFVLSGHIRRAGGLIRISVNLLSTETGEHVYSNIFDREYTPKNLFEIQEEIASYCAAKVAAPFGAVNRYNRRLNDGRQSSMLSYETILKYYEMNLSPTKNRARELLAEFESITEKTPRFSSAWAICSMLNTFLAVQSIPSGGKKCLENAVRSGTRATAIDPENGLGFDALFRAYFHSGKLDLAEKMMVRGTALNPNDYNMLAYYALAQAFMGHQTRALKFQADALDLIVRPPTWFYLSSAICAFQNKEFGKIYKLVKNFDEDSSAAVQLLGVSCAGHLGLSAEVKSFKERVLEGNPDYLTQSVNILNYWQPHPELLSLLNEGFQKAGYDFSA